VCQLKLSCHVAQCRSGPVGDAFIDIALPRRWHVRLEALDATCFRITKKPCDVLITFVRISRRWVGGAHVVQSLAVLRHWPSDRNDTQLYRVGDVFLAGSVVDAPQPFSRAASAPLFGALICPAWPTPSMNPASVERLQAGVNRVRILRSGSLLGWRWRVE